MKLEQQVCSLELAKKLKELGVKQKSYFWWLGLEGKYHLQDGPFDWMGDVVSAFTVAELGEMLPPMCIEGETIVAGKWQIDSFVA